MKMFGSIESKYGVDDPDYRPRERQWGRFESFVEFLASGWLWPLAHNRPARMNVRWLVRALIVAAVVMALIVALSAVLSGNPTVTR